MDINIVINKLIMLGFIMITGYTARKLNILNPTYNKGFSAFILNITLPCLVIDSILSTQVDITSLEIIQTMILATFIYGILAIISSFIVKPFKADIKQDGVYRFLLVFNNNMFMGFPIILSVLGEKAGFYCAIFNIINTLFMFSFGTYLMKKHKQIDKISLKRFINPVIITSSVCTVLYFLSYSTPVMLEESISRIGEITIPLSMIVLGVSLADIPVREVITDIKIYILIAIKMIFIPLAAFYILSLIISNTLMIYTVVVILAMPGATLCVSMATEYDGDIMAASKYVFLSTVLSLATIPMLISLII